MPEMAYVLGYFAADGSMIARQNGGRYIEITSTDRMLLEHVRSVTRAEQKISKRDRQKENWKLQYRLQIGSAAWFQDLARLGFTPNKSHTLSLPDIPPEYFSHFVRGYFDGDGCVYFAHLKYADRTRKRWIVQTIFTSGSREFLSNLHAQLKTQGLLRGVIGKKSNRGFELKFSHKDSLALYRIMYHTGEISGLFLPRKREKLEKAVQVLGLK
jgi:hypothetical protein